MSGDWISVRERVPENLLHTNSLAGATRAAGGGDVKAKACKCWKQVDEKLAEHNTRLARMLSFSGVQYLQLETEKVDNDKRGRPKNVVCSYCPFCGKKLPE